MYKILLISKQIFSSWEKFEILKRKDFEILQEGNFEDAFDKLVKEKFDLFIAEETPMDFSFKRFLVSVLNQLKIPNLKGIFICSTTRDLNINSLDFEILKTPLKVEELENSIVKLLNLKKRSSIRYIVRMHLGISENKKGTFQTCVTMNISKNGMQISSSKPLSIGKEYYWTFQGSKEMEGLTIKGTVLNKIQEKEGSFYRYGVKFNENCKEEINKIENFLKS